MFKIPKLVAKFPQVKAYSCNAQLFYQKKKKKERIIYVDSINDLFGSLEKEESRGEESSGEWFPSTLFGCF